MAKLLKLFLRELISEIDARERERERESVDKILMAKAHYMYFEQIKSHVNL